jgi:hypothetical protein
MVLSYPGLGYWMPCPPDNTGLSASQEEHEGQKTFGICCEKWCEITADVLNEEGFSVAPAGKGTLALKLMR